MAANNETGTIASTTANAKETAKEWLNKIDQSSVADLRKKYPKAIWLVGGIVLLSLII